MCIMCAYASIYHLHILSKHSHVAFEFSSSVTEVHNINMLTLVTLTTRSQYLNVASVHLGNIASFNLVIMHVRKAMPTFCM